MKFSLTIECGNTAFFDDDGEPDVGPEIARILRDLASYIVGDPSPQSGQLYDYNGNKTGGWSLD